MLRRTYSTKLQSIGQKNKYLFKNKLLLNNAGIAVTSKRTFILDNTTTKFNLNNKNVNLFLKNNSPSQKLSLETISKRFVQMKMNPNQGQAEKPALEEFGDNITELAKENKLDPVIGMDASIQRLLEILSRRTKNNPIIIGKAGTGKTTAINGLAQRIVSGQVPESLKNKQVISLELSKIVAGCKYRGEFEERLQKIIKEVDDKHGEVLLFIDEVHMLLGLGKSGDSAMDAANILKPKLAKGMRLIAATTLDEYRIIEKDPALARRFQSVIIEPPSVDDTITILRGLKDRYEVHHGVRILDSSLVAAANLSDRYLPNNLPDKAIDLLDEACAALRLQHESKPEVINELDRKKVRIQIELESLKKETDSISVERREALQKQFEQVDGELSRLTEIWVKERGLIDEVKINKENLEAMKQELQICERDNNFAKASELRYAKIPALELKLKENEKLLKKKKSDKNHMSLLHDSVSNVDISKVVSKMTGIPMENLIKSNEKDKLLFMEESLKHEVVGQDEAIQAISSAVRLQRAGLTSSDRPIASFFMTGPTGIGKSLLCKKLAGFLFNDERKLIRFDMSEYQEKHSISKLIGSPPGYVQSEEGGQLTEKVRRNPYSIVMFDEFEKAHPDVSKILLQVLDEGRLTDSLGNVVDFKNTIIVMTSNIGQDILLKEVDKEKNVEDGTWSPETKKKILDNMKHYYPPEFINRIDDIILFNRLTSKAINEIVKLRLEEVQERLVEKRIKLDVSEDVKKWLGENGYDLQYGARPLNRLILKQILNPMALLLLKSQIRNEEVVKVVMENGKITVLPNHDENEIIIEEPEDD
ncbi:chaperone ATPase hsp78 [Hanseniaspora valbyensis]